MVPGIDQLRDIRGLDPVSWWPPGPGLVAHSHRGDIADPCLVWWRDQRQRYPLGSWQKDAQRRLRALRRRLEEWDPKTVAGELSELLRRIAMARYGREACAGLVGNEWLEWLQARDPSDSTGAARDACCWNCPTHPRAPLSRAIPEATDRRHAALGVRETGGEA